MIGIVWVTVIAWIPNHGASYFHDNAAIAGGEARWQSFKTRREGAKPEVHGRQTQLHAPEGRLGARFVTSRFRVLAVMKCCNHARLIAIMRQRATVNISGLAEAVRRAGNS